MQTCPDEEPKRPAQRLQELMVRTRKSNPDGLTDYDRYIIREYGFQNNPEFCQAKRQRVASEYERLKMEGKVPLTSQWYRNAKKLAQYRKHLQEVYQNASQVPVEEIVDGSRGQQYRYELLMNNFRRVCFILDAVPVNASEERQEEALRALQEVVGTPPSAPERR